MHSILDREYGRHPYVISVSRASVSITVMVATKTIMIRHDGFSFFFDYTSRLMTNPDNCAILPYDTIFERRSSHVRFPRIRVDG